MFLRFRYFTEHRHSQVCLFFVCQLAVVFRLLLRLCLAVFVLWLLLLLLLMGLWLAVLRAFVHHAFLVCFLDCFWGYFCGLIGCRCLACDLVFVLFGLLSHWFLFSPCLLALLFLLFDCCSIFLVLRALL